MHGFTGNADHLQSSMNQVKYFGQHVGGIYKDQENNEITIYSDAATTCIIAFAWGIADDGKFTVIYGHLDEKLSVAAYFELVEGTFTKEPANIYAVGAAKVNKTGKKLYDKFMGCLEAMKFPKNYLSSTKLGEVGQHWLGFDCNKKEIVNEKLALKKEENYDVYGPQCCAWLLFSDVQLYVMDNSFTVAQVEDLELYKSIAAQGERSRESLLEESTSPSIEPEEYFENTYAAAKYANKILSQTK